ncbi:MAG TPA: hypothetical protein VJ978_08340 [Nitriliruptoraceae bacterium]|nr:hypothetical protein [Nitriliruptoraceae bacterium]
MTARSTRAGRVQGDQPGDEIGPGQWRHHGVATGSHGAEHRRDVLVPVLDHAVGAYDQGLGGTVVQAVLDRAECGQQRHVGTGVSTDQRHHHDPWHLRLCCRHHDRGPVTLHLADRGEPPDAGQHDRVGVGHGSLEMALVVVFAHRDDRAGVTHGADVTVTGRERPHVSALGTQRVHQCDADRGVGMGDEDRH